VVKLLYFLRAALAGLRTSPSVHAVAALTVSVALVLAALARFALEASTRTLESLGSDVEVTLYLKDDVKPDQARALLTRLQREEGGAFTLVSADEALARLRAELGGAGAVLSNLPKNPLPASIEVRPPADRRSVARVAEMASRWSGLPGVGSVEYGREWMERLEQLQRAARGAGALAVLIVLVAAVVVVAATLQLAIYARRQEIEIQKLVGATDGFVRAPFLLEGILQGLMGAFLAAGGLWTLSRYLGPPLSRALAFILAGLTLPSLVDPRALLQLCGAGAVLGLVGSLLAVRRFLRV
jgi:cell division transport system permease protein